MDRYDWTHDVETEFGKKRAHCWAGLDDFGKRSCYGYSEDLEDGDSEGRTILEAEEVLLECADEILRLAARLREAEELLRYCQWSSFVQHPATGAVTIHACPVCMQVFGEAHCSDCRLRKFLSEQTATPPG